MSNLKTRVEKLETATSPPAAPKSWSGFWAAMRLIYGDHGHYAPDELSQLDCVSPFPLFTTILQRVYGARDEHQNKDRET